MIDFQLAFGEDLILLFWRKAFINHRLKVIRKILHAKVTPLQLQYTVEQHVNSDEGETENMQDRNKGYCTSIIMS